jgi:arsenite methyltransferase
MDKIMQDSIQDYYGKTLQNSADLQTNACCTDDVLPTYIKNILKDVQDEVMSKFYGCGSPIPHAINGCHALDLGSGTGRDCFVISKLVGASGSVTGVDMTNEQLDVAIRHQDYHAQKWGFKNTRFLKGYMEDLKTLGLADDSIDLVTSNCVINLSPVKKQVFKEIFRVLKVGGELYFSDIFCSRRLPDHIKNDKVLVGECLGGAMYVEDFRRMLSELGIHDFRVVSKSRVTVNNPQLELMLGKAEFYSITIRAFKLKLEDRCEDFGQIAIYKGGIPESPEFFVLDDHHTFEKNKPLPVCSNTADMLTQSRFGKYFQVVGDVSTHFGLFDCGPDVIANGNDASVGACC